MAILITRTKNQIRPRSERVRLNNDAIKALGSNSAFDGGQALLIPAPAAGEFILLSGITLVCNFAAVYANVVDGAYLSLAYAGQTTPPLSAFGTLSSQLTDNSAYVVDPMDITNLLASTTGLTVVPLFPGNPRGFETSLTGLTDPAPNFWSFGSDAVGKPFVIDGFNGDSTDYTMGDPANTMDIYLYYDIITP